MARVAAVRRKSARQKGLQAARAGIAEQIRDHAVVAAAAELGGAVTPGLRHYDAEQNRLGRGALIEGRHRAVNAAVGRTSVCGGIPDGRLQRDRRDRFAHRTDGDARAESFRCAVSFGDRFVCRKRRQFGAGRGDRGNICVRLGLGVREFGSADETQHTCGDERNDSACPNHSAGEYHRNSSWQQTKESVREKHKRDPSGRLNSRAIVHRSTRAHPFLASGQAGGRSKTGREATCIPNSKRTPAIVNARLQFSTVLLKTV